ESRSRRHLHEPDRRARTHDLGKQTLAIDRLHPARVVALAGGRAGRQDRVEPLKVRAAKARVQRANILIEIADPLGARDWYHVIALGEYPGERELGCRAALLQRHGLDLADELDILLEIRPLEPRMIAPEVI